MLCPRLWDQVLPPKGALGLRGTSSVSNKNSAFVCEQKRVFFLFPVKTSMVIVFISKRKIIREKPTVFLFPGVGVRDHFSHTSGLKLLGKKISVHKVKVREREGEREMKDDCARIVFPLCTPCNFHGVGPLLVPARGPLHT